MIIRAQAAWTSVACVSVSLLFVLGCASAEYIPFTQQLRTTYKLSRSQVACLQYFLSDGVALERELHEGDVRVLGGRLERRDGRIYHVVEFPAEAPAILRPVRSIQMEIVGARFANSQPAPLYFSADSAHEGRYALAAYYRGGQFFTRFAGSEYSVQTGAGSFLQLRVENQFREKGLHDQYVGLTLEGETKADTVAPRQLGHVLSDPKTDSCVLGRTAELENEKNQLIDECKTNTRSCVPLAADYEWAPTVHEVWQDADLARLCAGNDFAACFVMTDPPRSDLQKACSDKIAEACVKLGDTEDEPRRSDDYKAACELDSLAACTKVRP